MKLSMQQCLPGVSFSGRAFSAHRQVKLAVDVRKMNRSPASVSDHARMQCDKVSDVLVLVVAIVSHRDLRPHIGPLLKPLTVYTPQCITYVYEDGATISSAEVLTV